MGQLEGEESPEHQDALAPGEIVRDRSVESPSQQIGNGTPDGPVVSFPDDEAPGASNQ